MKQIQYGCQTYPWKMNQKLYEGKVPHIVEETAKAGFQGLEAEICMLGDYFHSPQEVKELLDQYGLSLAALVLHQDWSIRRKPMMSAASPMRPSPFCAISPLPS